MATTLPGSPYVESSDLVANYPAVSESLAERVDLVGVLPFADAAARTTALPTPTDGQYSYLQDTNSTEVYNGTAWVASGIAPGLVHINTTTFSAVTSVSINDVFSSNYDDYLVHIRITGTTAGICLARLRVGGVDATAANYATQRNFVAGTSVTALRQLGVTGAPFTATRSTGVSIGIITVVNPFIVTETNFMQLAIDPNGTIETVYGGAKHSLATSYTGLTVYPDGGTITGTLRIFGYKNS